MTLPDKPHDILDFERVYCSLRVLCLYCRLLHRCTSAFFACDRAGNRKRFSASIIVYNIIVRILYTIRSVARGRAYIIFSTFVSITTTRDHCRYCTAAREQDRRPRGCGETAYTDLRIICYYNIRNNVVRRLRDDLPHRDKNYSRPCRTIFDYFSFVVCSRAANRTPRGSSPPANPCRSGPPRQRFVHEIPCRRDGSNPEVLAQHLQRPSSIKNVFIIIILLR